MYLKKVKLIDCNNFSSHCLYELLENCPELADLEVTLRYDRFSNFTEHIIVSNKDSIKRFKDSIRLVRMFILYLLWKIIRI